MTRENRNEPATEPALGGYSGYAPHAETSPGRVTGIDRWLLNKLMMAVGEPPVRVRLWDGDEAYAAPGERVAELEIRDRGALLALARNPELNFGEAYMTGRIEVEGNLVTFLEEINRALDRAEERSGGLIKRLHRTRPPLSNTPERSRDNIHHHYDLGNDFYRLWLDEEMAYTCAYFPGPEASLEQAQVAKMDHVARKLRLQPGETVAEAGCGWGALALHLARHYGVRVRAFNISKEQLAYARERAKSEGLDGQVEFVERDYREIEGEYDAFVSVGMLEHVGVDHYRTLGNIISRRLQRNGRGLIHTIGRDQPGLMNAWIEKRIFPSAQPPSLSQMMEIFEPYRFSVQDVENLRLHYAKTLEHWLQRYERHLDQVEAMFDPAFIRAWRLYLAGSIAAFTSGGLQLYQVVFTPQGNNDLPLTRDFLYKD